MVKFSRLNSWALVVVGIIAVCGCGGDDWPCLSVESAICENHIDIDSVVLDETVIPVSWATFKYSCYSETTPGFPDSRCYDPATEIDQWSQPYWFVTMRLVAEDVSSSVDLSISISVDATEAGVPVVGTTFNIPDDFFAVSFAVFYELDGTRQVVSYEAVQGQMKVVNASKDGYAFTFNNIVMEIVESDSTVDSAASTIRIETVSTGCAVRTWDEC